MAKNLIKSDTALRSSKPAQNKRIRINDGEGLYLLHNPDDSKYWRFDYCINGKRKTLSLGTYPNISLLSARRKAEQFRVMVAEGIDPSDTRKRSKQKTREQLEAEKRQAAGLPIIGSFEEVAREWGEKKVNGWEEKNNRSKRLLEINLFPDLGARSIGELKPADLLPPLRKVEARGALEVAHRTLQVCGQVFRYAVVTGRAERDITQDLRGALETPKKSHFAALVEPADVADLLRAIDAYTGSFVVHSALKLAPLVFVRPGELRAAEWDHIDFDTQEWRYLVGKTQTEHIVPLSRQALEILEKLQPVTGHGRFAFPSERNPRGDRCMSENTLNAALRRLGYSKEQMTSHGFRAMARTLLDEKLGCRVDFIEHQLAHSVKDPLGRAYNRTKFLDERRAMMQEWADYLDRLKQGAEVIPFREQSGRGLR